ncbi:hypothetical protein [Nostocoides jenkinsii]|uniref:Uncharacterized protein n=1 Tax=Nostocoides jenkinsii Ben 74 TaxID=1193518 RepID=A0A077MAH8_9MICO|nr:hypothetical protein [Tetrasphaera jenkinsii]CCI52845.1 hypothetical protein BN13_220030 [Tetrasphaera jenkinsii Ben 74]
MNLADLFGNLDTSQLADVVEVVAKNRDVIANLGKLPEFIGSLSTSMNGAGQEAKGAAVALIGNDGATGAKGALCGAAGALNEIVDSLTKGIAMIASAAEAAHKVPLMDGPASRLEEASREMSRSTSALGELAQSMATIAGVLGSVAGALDRVGDHLVDTGTQARGFLA